jgi:hypothetical protein
MKPFNEARAWESRGVSKSCASDSIALEMKAAEDSRNPRRKRCMMPQKSRLPLGVRLSPSAFDRLRMVASRVNVVGRSTVPSGLGVNCL